LLPSRAARGQAVSRRQEGPVTLVQPRPSNLPAKHRQLVAQHHDLEFLELTRPHAQRGDRKHTPKEQAQQRCDQATPTHPYTKSPDSTDAERRRGTILAPVRVCVPHAVRLTGCRGAARRG